MKLTESAELRGHVFKRMEELSMKDVDLLNDIEERGVLIQRSRWSKYKTGKKGGITDEQLLFVATRLGIIVSITFGKAILKGNTIYREVGQYNDQEAMDRLKLMFPESEIKRLFSKEK